MIARNFILLCLAIFAASSSMAGAQSAPTTPDVAIGRWINPRGSVVVETAFCGSALCGRVSWASPDAKKDATDAGIRSLIGVELLQNYSRTDAGTWRGRVYVPDMGRTFQSTIAVQDPRDLRISGCVLGGLICKTQVWRRL